MSKSLYCILAIGLFTLGCGVKSTTVVKIESVLCPDHKIDCQCQVLDRPDILTDFEDVKIHSLSLYEELSSCSGCVDLWASTYDSCKDKLNDTR